MTETVETVDYEPSPDEHIEALENRFQELYGGKDDKTSQRLIMYQETPKQNYEAANGGKDPVFDILYSDFLGTMVDDEVYYHFYPES